jgi:transposase
MGKSIPPAFPKAPRRTTLTLAYKRHILRECRETKKVNATAKKYNVYPSSIRKWKKAFEKALHDEVNRKRILEADTNPRKIYKRLKSTKRRRIKVGGRPTMLPQDFLDKLHIVLLHRRANNLSISLNLVRVEARRLDPGIIERVGESAFNHRIYRMMRKWGLSYRRRTTTCKAPQNVRNTLSVKEDFVRYVKWKIALLGVTEEDIFNVDQTNLPFSIETVYTWAKKIVEQYLFQQLKQTNDAQ